MRIIANGLLSVVFAVGLASCASQSGTCETVHADHAHKHNSTCGHKEVKHGDHKDYEHDGHLHAAHDTHVDEHKAGTAGDCKVHGKHAHKHNATCGHHAVKHGDHMDYMHDGHKHAEHGDHVDDHQG
jgi:hypothetical protein